jgi:hypothetical protein
MLKLLALLAIVWAALLPPLFTDGACTREFDAEHARVEGDRARIGSLAQARHYWNEREVSYQVMTVDQCRRARAEVITTCGPGPLVFAYVPVRNLICRAYRDDSIQVQFHYDARDRLVRIQSDMAPYKSLPLPKLGFTLHWAR